MTLRTLAAGGLAGTVASAALLVSPGPAFPSVAPTTGQPLSLPRSVDPGPVATTGDDSAAVALLRRAADAPRAIPYAGVQFVATWTPGASISYLVDVDHQPGRGTAVRVEDTSSRTGGVSFTAAQPTASTATTLAENKQGALATVGSNVLDVLADNYDLAVSGTGRVAGRATSVVEIRRFGGSVAARFWIDSATGLLLRREMYDMAGRTVRASAFIDLRIGTPLSASAMPPALPAAWGDQIPADELSQLRSEGWSCPLDLVPGMTLYDARRDDGATGPIVHLSYSDGLSAVSVFEQPGRLDDKGLDGFRVQRIGGADVRVSGQYPQRVIWSARGKVFTIIADAPADTVAAVVAALPHEPQRGGVWHRVGRGFARVGSWLNPFG